MAAKAEQYLTVVFSGRNDLKKTTDGLLDSLKKGAGKQSVFGEVGDVLKGGGAVAGLSILGNTIADASSGMLKLKEEIAASEKSTGEMVEAFFKGLPIIGGWVTAGRNFRELITGTTAENARLLAQEKAITVALEAQVAVMKLRVVNTRELAELNKNIERDIMKAQAPGTAAGLGIIGKQEDALKSLEKDIGERKQKIIDEHKKAQAAIQAELQKDPYKAKGVLGGIGFKTDADKSTQDADEARRKQLHQQLETNARTAGEAQAKLAQDAETARNNIERRTYAESQNLAKENHEKQQKADAERMEEIKKHNEDRQEAAEKHEKEMEKIRMDALEEDSENTQRHIERLGERDRLLQERDNEEFEAMLRKEEAERKAGGLGSRPGGSASRFLQGDIRPGNISQDPAVRAEKQRDKQQKSLDTIATKMTDLVREVGTRNNEQGEPVFA